MEIWKQIEEYPNYEVSNLGNIKSKSRRVAHHTVGSRLKKEKILIPAESKLGYLYVTLCRFDEEKFIQKSKTIHRLVAIAFIDNPENKPQVNHKDGNKLNNIPDNLEWNTASENSNHAVKNKLRVARKGSAVGHSKIKEQDVLEIRKSNLKLIELAAIYGISFQSISEIKNRKTWSWI